MSRRLLWTGVLLSLSQGALSAGCSDTGTRIVRMPDHWNPSIYVWLLPIGGEFWPDNLEKIHASLHAGDTVTIITRRMPILFSNRHLLLMTYRMEGPGGSRFFAQTSDGLTLFGALGSILLPLLVSAVVAIELSARS